MISFWKHVIPRQRSGRNRQDNSGGEDTGNSSIEAPLAGRNNIVYAGTSVRSGTASVLVVDTGIIAPLLTDCKLVCICAVAACRDLWPDHGPRALRRGFGDGKILVFVHNDRRYRPSRT